MVAARAALGRHARHRRPRAARSRPVPTAAPPGRRGWTATASSTSIRPTRSSCCANGIGTPRLLLLSTSPQSSGRARQHLRAGRQEPHAAPELVGDRGTTTTTSRATSARRAADPLDGVLRHPPPARLRPRRQDDDPAHARPAQCGRDPPRLAFDQRVGHRHPRHRATGTPAASSGAPTPRTFPRRPTRSPWTPSSPTTTACPRPRSTTASATTPESCCVRRRSDGGDCTTAAGAVETVPRRALGRPARTPAGHRPDGRRPRALGRRPLRQGARRAEPVTSPTAASSSPVARPTRRRPSPRSRCGSPGASSPTPRIKGTHCEQCRQPLDAGAVEGTARTDRPRTRHGPSGRRRPDPGHSHRTECGLRAGVRHRLEDRPRRQGRRLRGHHRVAGGRRRPRRCRALRPAAEPCTTRNPRPSKHCRPCSPGRGCSRRPCARASATAVRAAIPRSLTEAVDQLDDGLLDAVMERGACYVPTPDGTPAEGTWADRHPDYARSSEPLSTEPAYQVTKGGALDVDTAMYTRIADADRTTLESFTIPIRTGRAWTVPAGHLCRITVIEGPQVGDLNIWNANNPRERMWAAKTRQLQAAHVRLYDRLWSNLPYLRPLVTLVGDSLADYGVDGDGGRVHDLLGSRCDPYTNQLLSGERFDFHCHSNLTRAVLPHGLERVRRPRRAQRLPGDRAQRRRQVLQQGLPGEEGRLLRVLRRDRRAVRAVDVPGWRPVHPAVRPRRPRPTRGVPTAGHRGIRPDPLALEGWTSPEPGPYKGFHGLEIPQSGTGC